MQAIRLDEALDQLLDSALTRLNAHNVEGGLLEGIQFIERGDRTQRAPRYPALILTTGIANPVDTTALTVKYDVPLRIWSQIYSNRPALGEPEARRYAGMGFHALLRAPEDAAGVSTLEATLLMRPGPFEPPGPGIDENTYVGRAQVMARIQATF